MQTTSKVFMVRPARFTSNEETAVNNYFQKGTPLEDIAEISNKAIEEFDSLVKILKVNDVDVIILQDTPTPFTPDSVFPNNWFTSHLMGEMVLYPMFAPNRRLERKPSALKLLHDKSNHRKIIDLTHYESENEYLEGTGSLVLDRDKKIAYCCRSPRSSEKVLSDFCARMNYQSVVFDATDNNNRPIYHTNVMMTIGQQIAVICRDAIKDTKERESVTTHLQSSGKIIVDITLDQVDHFAGNMLELKSRNGSPLMIMSTTALDSLTAQQIQTISTFTRIISLNLSTIETHGGGSARCMIAEIFS